MKNIGMNLFGIAVIVIIVLCNAVIGFAQVAQISASRGVGSAETQESLKAKFASLGGVINFSTPEAYRAYQQRLVANAQASRSQSANTSEFGPRPVFLLQSNRQFVSVKESMDLSLVRLQRNGRELHYSGIIQVLKPGPAEGHYDGTYPVEYVSFSTRRGLQNEAEPFDPIRILSRVFNNEDPRGTYTFSIVMYEEGDFVLAQQIIYDVYYGSTGRFGRLYYASKIVPETDGVRLRGRFSIDAPIYFMMSSENGAILTGPDPQWAPRSDGTKLFLPGMITPFRTSPVNIMMWDPVSRYAITLPNAFAIDTVSDF